MPRTTSRTGDIHVRGGIVGGGDGYLDGDGGSPQHDGGSSSEVVRFINVKVVVILSCLIFSMAAFGRNLSSLQSKYGPTTKMTITDSTHVVILTGTAATTTTTFSANQGQSHPPEATVASSNSSSITTASQLPMNNSSSSNNNNNNYEGHDMIAIESTTKNMSSVVAATESIETVLGPQTPETTKTNNNANGGGYVADINDGRNQTIWFLGNSISRGHAFAANYVLNSNNSKTTNTKSDGINSKSKTYLPSGPLQQEMCGKGGRFQGQRPGQGKCYGACGCFLGELAEGEDDNVVGTVVRGNDIPNDDEMNVTTKNSTIPRTQNSSRRRIGFLWQQQVDGQKLRDLLLGSDPDYTIREGDLVFINVGLQTVVDYDTNVTQAMARESPRFVSALQDAVDAGRHVIFRYSTPICSRGLVFNKWTNSSINGLIDDANDSLRVQFEQHEQKLRQGKGGGVVNVVSKSTGIRSIPTTHVNVDCMKYKDFIHPGDDLAVEQVQQLLHQANVHYGDSFSSFISLQ